MNGSLSGGGRPVGRAASGEDYECYQTFDKNDIFAVDLLTGPLQYEKSDRSYYGML